MKDLNEFHKLVDELKTASVLAVAPHQYVDLLDGASFALEVIAGYQKRVEAEYPVDITKYVELVDRLYSDGTYVLSYQDGVELIGAAQTFLDIIRRYEAKIKSQPVEMTEFSIMSQADFEKTLRQALRYGFNPLPDKIKDIADRLSSAYRVTLAQIEFDHSERTSLEIDLRQAEEALNAKAHKLNDAENLAHQLQVIIEKANTAMEEVMK